MMTPPHPSRCGRLFRRSARALGLCLSLLGALQACADDPTNNPDDLSGEPSSALDAQAPSGAGPRSDARVGSSDARAADVPSAAGDAATPGDRDAAASAADAAVHAGGDAGAATRAGWHLVFDDEFEGVAGASPDPMHWVFETGGGGFGNNELEYYTARPENAALDGQGKLVITARAESYMGSKYTSARLKTAGKFEHTYGRYEARLRIPKGQGLWPAFWMLGADIGKTAWPACGEIDIMENIGKEPTLIHGTLHGPGYSGGNSIGKQSELPGKARFADDFHVFAVEWEDKVVRWYVDDVLYETRTPADLPAGSKWVYDHPFFILLNLAVGGQWPGSPDGTTSFPQQLSVDYVRVYDRD
ncbi:MAG: Beta-glucanase/beta-glucan synthetase [Myxococcaceae bacterium]|nr:Beta-glucanase/beta-glucan synthetase [Myxococcaceae bacterium]